MNTTIFFSSLKERAAADNAVVATLRRSLARDPGTDASVFPLVEPWTEKLNPTQRQSVYLVAGLWALGARSDFGSPVPLAEACRTLARRDGSSAGIERRMTQLLDSDSDELVWRLRQLLALLNSTGAAVDWPQLLDDLLAWNRESKSVQLRWARAFWG
jgi:CRISPR system Cascade subunit CasB